MCLENQENRAQEFGPFYHMDEFLAPAVVWPSLGLCSYLGVNLVMEDLSMLLF